MLFALELHVLVAVAHYDVDLVVETEGAHSKGFFCYCAVAGAVVCVELQLVLPTIKNLPER